MLLYRDSQTFADFLRAALIWRGYSQNAFARSIDVDQAYVNKLCHGTRPVPSRPIVLRIADALELTPDERDVLLHRVGYATVHDWRALALGYWRALRAIDVAVACAAPPPTHREETP